MADVAAGQIITAQLFNNKTRKCIARGRRVTNSSSSTSTTSVGVLRLDDKPVQAGKTIRITWKMTFDCATSTDTVRGHIRYTTDGSTPTTASPLLPGSSGGAHFISTSDVETRNVSTDYTPAGDETLSLLLCIAHMAGTGAMIAQADGTTYTTDMYIDDMGDDPGNSGTSV